ncbi:unnamed protein product [Brassica rapa subsp. trilocularis]
MVNPWLTMVIDSPRNPASPDGSPSHPPPLPDPPDPLHFPPLPLVPSSASVEELPFVPAVSSIPPLGLATDTSPPLGPAVMSIDLFLPSSPTPVIFSGNSDPPSPSDSEMVDLSSTDPPSFILALLAPFHDRHIPSTPPTIPASIPPLITATSFNPFIPSLPSSNSLTLHLKPAQSFSVISNKNPFAPLALDLDTFPETSSVASASPPSAQGEARSNL